MIPSLYKDYFQKSKIFLYPMLDIRKGTSVAPIQTYISWDRKYKPEDKKLIGLYLIDYKEVSTKEDRKLKKRVFQKDPGIFDQFEKYRLIGNKLFEHHIDIGEQLLPPDVSLKEPGIALQRIYIFNYSEYAKDWNHFLEGRYSMFTKETKMKIKNFFRSSESNFVYIESFLHPDKYHSLYSELLGVSVDLLKKVRELTDPPDMSRETLHVSIQNLNQIIK